MALAKRFKIFIPGEVFKNVEQYTFSDGTVVNIEEFRKIVVPSKKNERRIRVNPATLRPILLDSEQHVRWKKENLIKFQEYAKKIAAAGISVPLVRGKIKILFYFPDSRSRDLTNKAETIADIMVDAGILMDDDFKILKPIYLDGWVDRSRPRTEIYLTLIDPASDEYHWDITPESYFKERTAKRNLKRRIRADRKRKEKIEL